MLSIYTLVILGKFVSLPRVIVKHLKVFSVQTVEPINLLLGQGAEEGTVVKFLRILKWIFMVGLILS